MIAMTVGPAIGDFSDGAALIIGGSGGMGAAICTAIAQAGGNVAFTYRSQRKAAEALAREIGEQGGEAYFASVDMLDAAAMRRFVAKVIARFGHIHSVVYAAGPAMEFLYINEIQPEEWARVANSDINGCFNMVAAVLPHLRERKRGAIVALVTAAVERAPPRDILSAAPKAAIQALFRGLAREEGHLGIRVNCVGPGYIEPGPGQASFTRHTGEFVARMVETVPLKRAGQAQDVANAVLFLLSDKASYITGETISVAGGLQLA